MTVIARNNKIIYI